jgi:nucleoside-diphosphate-sugar epimerase
VNLKRNFAQGSVEYCEADLASPDATARAVDGCDVLFLCVGLPLNRYDEHITIARTVTQAMMQTKAKCVAATGYWSYAPVRQNPIREDHLRRGGGRFAKVRQLQEDLLTTAGAAVAMLPDFFGPGASVSMVNDAFAMLARGKRAQWPGDPAAPRDFLFMPDVGRPLVELATRKGAFGQRWNLAGSGPIQPRLLLEMGADRLGEGLRLRTASPWMLKLASRVSTKATLALDLYPIYSRPAYMDGAAIRKLIGEYRVTPYSQAVDRTLRWMTGGRAQAA